jgi:phosphopentomutase
LIDELEKETGHKIIGNYASLSGTEILKVLGEEQMKENSLIVYTSADSVLQIAAHEEVTGKEELYRCCEIARKSAWRRNISSAGSSPVLTSAPIKITSNGSSATGATMPFRLRPRP